MAVLSGGDMVAQGLKYHYFCLTALYNKERAYLLTIDNPVVFRLTDIVSLSKERFKQVGMKTHDAKAIFDKVQKLYTVMTDMGNPFIVMACRSSDVGFSFSHKNTHDLKYFVHRLKRYYY
jgi:hypothetical protein